MGMEIRAGIGKVNKEYNGVSSILLGGIKIPVCNGMNDELPDDQLIHAISDAMLGAAGLGGIRNNFDFHGEQKTEFDELLRETERKVHYSGYKIVNIDTTIAATFPITQKQFDSIRLNLASIIFVKPEQINLKLNIIAENTPEPGNVNFEIISVVLLKKR